VGPNPALRNRRPKVWTWSVADGVLRMIQHPRLFEVTLTHIAELPTKTSHPRPLLPPPSPPPPAPASIYLSLSVSSSSSPSSPSLSFSTAPSSSPPLPSPPLPSPTSTPAPPVHHRRPQPFVRIPSAFTTRSNDQRERHPRGLPSGVTLRAGASYSVFCVCDRVSPVNCTRPVIRTAVNWRQPITYPPAVRRSPRLP
jgi:hypothetical protein